MMLIGWGTGVAVGVTVDVAVGSGVELAVAVIVSGRVGWVGMISVLAEAHPEARTAKMTRMRKVFFMNTPLELRKPVRLNPYHPTRSPICGMTWKFFISRDIIKMSGAVTGLVCHGI
jgi:hypothetical protein